MYLVTNVLDKKALTAKSAGVLYEMRSGVEVFYRSLKQTLEKRRMLSRTPEAARCELTWALLGLWLLSLMTAVEVLARGGDPLGCSAAQARDRVRRSMRRALTRRHEDRGLGRELAWAVKDGHVRQQEGAGLAPQEDREASRRAEDPIGHRRATSGSETT